MPPRRDREGAREILRLKIGDEKNDRASGHDLVQIIERERLGSVPRPCGSKKRISRMMRNVWERPFFGGMKSSTRSVKRSRPTLSLLRIALKASRHATSAASSRFDCETLPKLPEALTSTTSMTVSSRSSVNFLTNGVPEPRRHVPIDRANFVARLILAHVLEIHPATFEDAVVIAGEGGLDEPVGLDFERADFLQDFRGACSLHRRLRVQRGLRSGQASRSDDEFPVTAPAVPRKFVR